MDIIIDDWLALSLAQGLGLRGYWRLIEVFETPSKVLACTPDKLVARTGLRKSQVAGLASPESLRLLASEVRAKHILYGAQVVNFESPLYPSLLQQISDPPPVLYAHGNTDLLNRPSLAIVGSRASTSYGRRVASHIAGEVCRAGYCVVSGLAYGVDAQAHEGALAAGGDTVAVLGCGLDVVYPWQNRKIYDKIRNHGVLLSEYPLGTRPDSFRFPARNRIIAGMSAGVLVVEAAKKSGSLITAQMALDCGREVFAVPGQVDSVKSAGAHWLLQQGAKLVQSVEDILEELPDQKVLVATDNQNLGKVTPANLTEEEQTLLDALDVYPIAREVFYDQCGMPVEKISEILLLLELEDLVEILPGDMLRRV